MGGRGASSGGGSVVPGVKSGYTIVNPDGSTVQWYFNRVGEQNFYKTSIGGVPTPTYNNMSEKEMIETVRRNGRTVTKKSNNELRKEYQQYEDYQTERNRFLDNAYAQDTVFTRGMRAARTANRAARRNRR